MNIPEPTLAEQKRELSYTLDIRERELSAELKKLHHDVLALEDKKKEVISKLVKTVQVPAGWSITSISYDYTGEVKAKIYKSITITEVPKVIVDSKINTRTPLQKLLQDGIELKTLLNSGILTKEEKRKLLGIDELFTEPKL